MDATLLLLSAICIPGLIWSIDLWRRARDMAMRLLALLLGLMPIYQTLLSAIERGSLSVPGAYHLRNVIDLAVNVVFLFSIFLLEYAIEQRNRADLKLRMMESNVTVYREGELVGYFPKGKPLPRSDEVDSPPVPGPSRSAL